MAEIKALDMFHTPESWTELQNWIERHSVDERAHLTTAAIMAWNLAAKVQASTDAATEVETKTESEEAETWTEVEDADVFHVWRDDETGEETTIPPTFYQDNGTPVADSGEDMVYVRTVIRGGPRQMASIEASVEDVARVTAADPASDDGRGPWIWVRLDNGDLFLATYPQGDLYIEISDRLSI